MMTLPPETLSFHQFSDNAPKIIKIVQQHKYDSTVANGNLVNLV